MKICCVTCDYMEATASDGVMCSYRGIYSLEEFVDIDICFCDEYNYNHCLGCEELEYVPDFICDNCTKY